MYKHLIFNISLKVDVKDMIVDLDVSFNITVKGVNIYHVIQSTAPLH